MDSQTILFHLTVHIHWACEALNLWVSAELACLSCSDDLNCELKESPAGQTLHTVPDQGLCYNFTMQGLCHQHIIWRYMTRPQCQCCHLTDQRALLTYPTSHARQRHSKDKASIVGRPTRNLIFFSNIPEVWRDLEGREVTQGKDERGANLELSQKVCHGYISFSNTYFMVSTFFMSYNLHWTSVPSPIAQSLGLSSKWQLHPLAFTQIYMRELTQGLLPLHRWLDSSPLHITAHHPWVLVLFSDQGLYEGCQSSQ